MSVIRSNLKPIVAALCAIVMFSLPAVGQDSDAVRGKLPELYDSLATATPGEAKGLEREIKLEWRKTGSAAMDLLLKRGRDALERGDFTAAVDHLTALTDHAPDVAEGFHMRARAYFRLDQIGPALADLETALALDPRHYEAAHGLAVMLEELNRPQQAYQAYRLVLSIHPHYDPAAEAVTRLKSGVEGLKL
jgi:Tfp pilus assembly protein PilF